MYRNGNAQPNLFVSRPLDTSNDVPVMEGVKRHFRGGMSDGRTPSCLSSDRSARAGHGRGDGRTVARRLPAPERPQNPRTPRTDGSGHAGRAPCRLRGSARARRGGIGAAGGFGATGRGTGKRGRERMGAADRPGAGHA